MTRTAFLSALAWQLALRKRSRSTVPPRVVALAHIPKGRVAIEAIISVLAPVVMFGLALWLAFVDAVWPLAEEQPDVGRWAREFAEAQRGQLVR